MFNGLSIVIPYHNDPEIKDCIQSVVESYKTLNPQQKSKVEIIIVDDKSKIPCNHNLKELGIQYIHNEKNLGAGASRNRGADKSQFSHILFIDADVLLSINYLSNIFSILSSQSNLKVLQYPHHYIPANKPTTVFHSYMALSWFYNSTVTTLHPDGHPTALISSCVCFNKSYFQSIGGYKAKFSGSGGEEFDITQRIPHGDMVYNQRLESYNYFDDLTLRLKKVFKRSKNYSETIGKNSNMLLQTKLAHGLRALLMTTLSLSLILACVDFKVGTTTYISLYLISLVIDFRITLFFLTKSNLTVTLVSVFFRQLEYTTITAGMALRLVPNPFMKQNQGEGAL